MESPGQWLENALVDLCKKVETGLDLDRDIISGLVSYCDLAEPVDAKEYLDNIIGQEIAKSVIEEYLLRRGHSNISSSTSDASTSKLHAYVKPSSNEHSASGVKMPFKGQKEVTGPGYQTEQKTVTISSNPTDRKKSTVSLTAESKTTHKGNHSGSKKKKSGKVVSLAEAAKGSIVFQQGKPCSCQARRHRLVSNCLSCGKIICEQEGEGPCSFCGVLVLREGSTYAGLEDSLPLLSDAEADAEAYAKRLVEYDRNSAARTTVIDDQSDYYEIEGNSWLSPEERELLMKKQTEADELKRSKVVVTFDLFGRKVLVNEDGISESESELRILGPQDDREVNRIKPNPSLKIQPHFVAPSTSRKPDRGKLPNRSQSNGLCLEITGRVQYENNGLKGLMKDNELTMA